MRRGLGIGRALVAVGSVLALIGCFLPWLSAGEVQGAVVTSNGLNGTGLLVFLASIGLLLVLLLPYASASGLSALDKPLTYALLAAMGIVGLVIWVVSHLDSITPLPPDRSLGLWFAVVGMVLVALGVGDLMGEKTPGSPLRPKR